MAAKSKSKGRKEGDADPGRTGPTGQDDEITRLGNTPGGGSAGAAESGGLGGITGAAGGNLSGGPDVDAATSSDAPGDTTPVVSAPTVGIVTAPAPRTRVLGGSVAHPYGVDPTEGPEDGQT